MRDHDKLKIYHVNSKSGVNFQGVKVKLHRKKSHIFLMHLTPSTKWCTPHWY